MRVRVLLFAVIRDAAQTGEMSIELPPNAVAKDAVAAVAVQFPQVVKYLARSAIAINRQYASAETALADDDELALIPPVSGG